MDENNIGYGATKAFLDKFAGKAAEKPAETFAAVWDLVFGGFHNYVEKINLQRQKDFEDFKDSISKNMQGIPAENLQEPQLSLLGPALESTKYYIHDEELRNLFINLISKSMDNRYKNQVNHAFVEIIKQMSPIDAYLIKKINKQTLPIAKYIASNRRGSISLSDYTLIDDIFNSEEIQISLINIRRLGLIEIPEGSSLVAKSLYDKFEETEEYYHFEKNNLFLTQFKQVQELVEICNNDVHETSRRTGKNVETLENALSYKGVSLKKSHVSLTKFGNAFYEVCVI